MTDATALAGFIGTTLAIVAYLPQIQHLIKERCTAGLSVRAYWLWFAAASLLLVHAAAIGDPVFMLLQAWQLLACSLILYFCAKYKGSFCETHRHPRPA